MRRLAAALLAAAVITAGVSADARMHAPYRGHRIVPANVGALDGFTTPAAAYSLRKLRSAYAGSAVKLRRTTGGTQDIGFAAGGDFDTAAAATFCAATTCFLDTWYDQSGLGRHATQATTANQPAYIADCGTGKPCARATAAGMKMVMAGTVTPALPVSLNAVAHRNIAGGACYTTSMIDNFGNQIVIGGAASWALSDGAAFLAPASTAEGAWHTATGVIAGAASVINVDGVETTGAVTGIVTAGGFTLVNMPGAGSQCSMAEAVIWNGYALTPAERTALQTNQKNYWMPAPLDSFAAPAAAYSMRRLKSTYAGPAIRLRRASDNAEQDINFLGFTSFTGAPIDTAAAAAHCAATSCTVATWYDQSGNARDGTRAAAQQPSFIFNCNGTLPCLRASSSGQLLGAPNSAVALPVTMTAVAVRNSGAGTCVFPQHYEANNSLGATAANSWTAYSTGSVTAAAPDAAWHSAVGVLNTGAGASSIRVDGGADVTGTVTPSTTASSLLPFYGADTTVCSAGEVVWWSGYALTAAEKTALIANQRSFWGF